MGDRVKEGISLIVVDSSGVQLFSRQLGGWNMEDYDSQCELGKSIAEGLPENAYEDKEVLAPGVYDSYHGNAISWDGTTVYDLDMGKMYPLKRY